MAEGDQPTRAGRPRYTNRTFPTYRFLPGTARIPVGIRGHSFEQPDPNHARSSQGNG